MKLGIFSDVHANYPALRRVVELLRGLGATRFLCAGDIVGYGPDPVDCLRLIRSLPATAVAGNHDRGAVGRQPEHTFNPAARAALAWTAQRLDGEGLAYLAALALTDETDPVHLVHSSPSAPEGWSYVHSAREAAAEMDSFSLPLCVIGHTHIPFAAERHDGRTRQVGPESFEIRPGCRYVVNAGSVGQPRDGDPRACCALYDTDCARVGFFRVDYDIASVRARMKQVGLPECLADRLARGR